MLLYRRSSLKRAKDVLETSRLFARTDLMGPVNWGPFFFVAGEPEHEVPTSLGWEEATLYFECNLPIIRDYESCVILEAASTIRRNPGHLWVEYYPGHRDAIRQCRIIPPAPDALTLVGYQANFLPWSFTKRRWNQLISSKHTISVDFLDPEALAP